MKSVKNYMLLVLIVFLIVPSFSQAEDKKPMTIIDRINLPSLGSASLSPDGTQLVYVKSEADWKQNKRMSHIWRINSDGTGIVQLTNGSTGESSPTWSPDGKWIAFTAKRDDADKIQIYMISNSGGEAKAFTDHDSDVSGFTWSPDGKFIYFLATDAESEEVKKRKDLKDDIFHFDHAFGQRRLWKISVEEGKESLITEGEFSIASYDLSRDGTKIAFLRGDTPNREDFDVREVWVMNADGSGIVQITENGVGESSPQFSPDNSQVLFLAGANEKFETYYNTNIFIAAPDGSSVKMLMPEMPHQVRGAKWSADGKSIYFLANMGVHTELFVLDLATEQYKQLTDGKHSLRSWSYYPKSGNHSFTITTSTSLGDAWKVTTDGEVELTRITHMFDYLNEEFYLPRQEVIRWQGADGVTVEGLLSYPIDYEEGKKYPLVVKTHGGPQSADQYSIGGMSSPIPVFAAKGYAFFQPNYRGSTGYGDDFLRDMVGSYYHQSHLDVMTGVDHLIKLGIADENRMVKMGWSAGGHMTNKIITHTNRFKAASSGAGAVNWISMYAQSDTRIYRTPWFGGTPWQKDAPIDVYWDNSPLKDIWKVKTPTLVLVGANDVRVPPPQSMALYRALKSNGVATKLYMAPREPHGWRELRHQLFKANVELDWFEKYCMEREYTWEKAPGDAEEKEVEEQ